MTRLADAPPNAMRCPSCQHENPPDSTFCLSCGGRLTLTCASCGADLPGGSRFCNKCGTPVRGASVEHQGFVSPRAYTPAHLAEKILTSKSALEGERKQVTVLFVDVSGFTSLSERLDPEDIHRLMTRAFELMLAEVHRFEGTVNQFLGDGIMALFGAPIAHEDHAQRAVHAALGLRTTLDRYGSELERSRGIRFEVRQGLNTGLVVVGSIGDDLRMDYTAVGDTTNLAARLQQAADRGRIVISGMTHRLVEGYFHTRPLGPLALKGKAEPVPAWEVISARASRTRFDVAAERGLTPFVGRVRELQLLQERFERGKAGEGQVVFIVGEPGIGKSRLLYEFRSWLGDEATWLEGRCISFGRPIALHPVIDLVKRNFRIDEGDSEPAIVDKVERGILLLGEDLRPLVPYVRYLLSVDPGEPAVLSMDPQQRRAEIFDTLRQLLVRASEVRPQVMVIEDVHWIDQASEDSLLYIADGIPRHRILQILTYRPGYNHRFGEHTYHTRIALTTLTAEDSIRIAQALLAAESLPEELRSLIAMKAEGSPFYVEELVKSLQEVNALRREGDRYVLARPIEEVVVPNAIQDVIMARIDRLEEAPKKTLQLASVIGREFTRRLLDRIADIRDQTEGVLRELKAIELIYEKALFPELAYMFKHALTHDVAYHSLLVQRRKELHRLIGFGIEELYRERVSEHYEVLAHHFSRAEDWKKALDYLLKAAEKSAKAFASREAITFYDQALDVTRRLGDAVSATALIDIHRARAGVYLVLSDFESAHAAGKQVHALAQEAMDGTAEATALAGMGYASFYAHRFDQALDESHQAIAIARRHGATRVLATGHLTVGLVHAIREGRLAHAAEWLERALDDARSTEDAAIASISLSTLGLLQNWQGRFADAASLKTEGLGIAREHNLLFPTILGLWGHGLTLIGKGDYDDALTTLQEGLTLCQKVGEEIYRDRILNTLGWLWIECGDLDRATDHNRRGAESARKRGDPETIANAEINLGDVFLARGDLPLALDVLDGVHGLVKNPATGDWMKWRYSAHLFASLGELWLARGDTTRAVEFSQQCLELATRSNSRKYLVRGWRLQGEIALARRQWDEANTALRTALDSAEAIGNPPQLWKTHVAIGRLHGELGRVEAARQAYRAARGVIERVRAHLRNADVRASIEHASMTREVHRLATPEQ